MPEAVCDKLATPLELDYDTVETALISLGQCIEKVVVDQV